MAGNTDGLNATQANLSGNQRPVEKVSWEDIQVFIYEMASLPVGWALPTEAQILPVQVLPRPIRGEIPLVLHTELEIFE